VVKPNGTLLSTVCSGREAIYLLMVLLPLKESSNASQPTLILSVTANGFLYDTTELLAAKIKVSKLLIPAQLY
jgi:hypothetical protein